MDVGQVAQLITSVATLVGVVGGVFVSVRNSQKLDEVHTATDGMSKALAETKLAQGTAEGKAVGLKEGRAEAEAKP